MTYEEDKSTITKTPDEIIKIEILERRAKLHNAIEKYWEYKIAGGGESKLFEVQSRLMGLFNTIQASLARSKESKDKSGEDWLREAKEKIVSGDVEDVFKVHEEIEKFLDETKLTRFDNIEQHDYTRIEEDNERAGM